MGKGAFWRFSINMDMIAIGKIRTSHGVKGYLKIVSYSGETEHFFKLKNVILKYKDSDKYYTIEDIKPLGDSIILKLNGVDTPESGRSLSNWEIWVPRDSAASLSKDEFYHADLFFCDLFFEGDMIGHIKSILEGGGGELLELILSSGKTALIPFKSEFIGDISIKDKRVELKSKWILG